MISEKSNAPSQNWDFSGWNRVVESNGYYREWDNERYSKGYMTSEIYDSENERIHLSAFLIDKSTDGMNRMEWIAKNAVISLVHGMTELGFVPLGSILAWKHAGDKIEVWWGVKKGSELIDHLWENHISKEENAGLSIGGQILDKSCDWATGKCDVLKADIPEVAWTPTPMNMESINTFINKMAKTKKIFYADKPDMEKDCDKKKESHKAIVKAIWKYYDSNARELTEKCKQCNEFVNTFDSVSKGLTELQSLADNMRKVGLMRCDECGYSNLMGDTRTCPLCGGRMHPQEMPPISMEITKAKVPLSPGQTPPEGASVIRGPRGGRYYESGEKAPSEKPSGKPKEKKPKPNKKEIRQELKEDYQKNYNFDRSWKESVTDLVVNYGMNRDDAVEFVDDLARDVKDDIGKSESLKSLPMEVKKMEPEDKKKKEEDEEVDKTKKADEPASKPEKKEEEEEEMDLKTLTKNVLEMQKALESTNLLVQDMAKTLKKDDGTGDEDENKVTEEQVDKKPDSDEVAPGLEISGATSKTAEDITKAVNIEVEKTLKSYGIEKGTPKITPKPEVSLPGGIPTHKTNDLQNKIIAGLKRAGGKDFQGAP